MLILGLETSCDETGVALYDTGRGLLAHALFSQVDIHVEYGGVVPELASRDQVRNSLPGGEQVLDDLPRQTGHSEALMTEGLQEVTGMLVQQPSLPELCNVVLETMYRAIAGQMRDLMEVLRGADAT